MLSSQAVLVLNYGVVLLPTASILAITSAAGAGAAGVDDEERDDASNPLAHVAALSARQWACLLSLSLGVYIGAMQAQLLAIRLLGPTLLAAVMPLRLISSVIGSQLLLGERITSLAEAAGLLTVALTTTVYLGRQVLVARRRKTPRESDPRAQPQLQEEEQRRQPELPQQAQMELSRT